MIAQKLHGTKHGQFCFAFGLEFLHRTFKCDNNNSNSDGILIRPVAFSLYMLHYVAPFLPPPNLLLLTGDLDPNLIHGFLDSSNPPYLTASRSSQLFSRIHFRYRQTNLQNSACKNGLLTLQSDVAYHY